MIGGSVVGDMVGGQWVFDALVIDLPVDGVTITDYEISVAGGASIDLPLDSVTLEDFPIKIAFAINLPVDSVSLEDFAISVFGGASIFLPVDNVTITDYPLDVTIIINGVPDFYLNRDGAVVDIVVRNRDGRTVKAYRADNYNISYTDLVNFTADTYQNTGLDVNKSYKYKLAFTDGGSIIGIRSTGKYTK